MQLFFKTRISKAISFTIIALLPTVRLADNCMTAPTTVNVDCALNVTRARADFLQARITECRTVGCAISRLGDY